MQLLQKDFDMEKTYVDALWTYRIQENIPVINADPGCTVIHQLMLHQKLKVHLKHDRETISPKNCTFSLGDLHSLFPPNFRALRFVAVE